MGFRAIDRIESKWSVFTAQNKNSFICTDDLASFGKISLADAIVRWVCSRNFLPIFSRGGRDADEYRYLKKPRFSFDNLGSFM